MLIADQSVIWSKGKIKRCLVKNDFIFAIQGFLIRAVPRRGSQTLVSEGVKVFFLNKLLQSLPKSNALNSSFNYFFLFNLQNLNKHFRHVMGMW